MFDNRLQYTYNRLTERISRTDKQQNGVTKNAKLDNNARGWA
jgi:hypothetical protein